MPGPEKELEDEVRKKRTIWLMAGGAASLILPLLGVAYLHFSASSGTRGPSGRSDVFERREGGDKRLVPSQTAVPVAVMATPPPSSLPTGGRTETPSGSSLDFIKPNQDLAAKMNDAAKPAAAAPAAAPAAPAAPAPAAEAPKTASKTPAKKGGKKAFTMPKLQTSRGFTQMGGAKGGAAAAPQGGADGGGDVQDLLKNLPPGSENNPQLQQYLKSQGK